MKRFVWRLQKVLDVKTKQEELRRTELFRLTEQLAQRRGALLLCRRALQDIMRGIGRGRTPERLAAQEFFLRHAAASDKRIRQLEDEIAVLEARQKEKTAELLALRKSKEGLERLRAEAKERFIREQEKLEQKEMDDRTTMAFAGGGRARET